MVGATIGTSVGGKVGAKVGSKSSLQKVSEISNCTTLNEENKTYILTRDINASENTCINISADNIVLDCRWHKISGNGNNIGIKINGNDVMVENCIIKNFSDGTMINANESTVYCNIIQENLQGIIVGNNLPAGIYKNLIRNNTYGINGNIENLTIDANEIIKNTFGIFAYGIINATEAPDLTNNVICSNDVNVNFTYYTNISNCTLPDLAITEIHVPLISDGNLTINVTAENLFTNLYNNSAVVSIVIEGNNQTTFENKTIDANISIRNLSFNFSLHSGIYFVTTSISPTSEINESNKLNNVLSNALVVIKENQSIIYGKTEHSGRLLPNINLTLNNSNTGEILNLSSDENGFFEIVPDEGNYTLKSIYSKDGIPINVTKNSFLNLNITLNLITFNVTSFNNISLESAKITIIDANTSEGVTLFTNTNGIAEFLPFADHEYNISVFKDRYAYYNSIIKGSELFPAQIVIITEECMISSGNNTSYFENYTLKIYGDLQNKIRQNKIERVISYSVNKKNMSVILPTNVGVKIGAKTGVIAKCYVNITNIPENLTVTVIENVNGTVTEKPANSSFNGIEIVRMVERIGNKTIPLGDVNINFTYKNPDFGNVTAESGEAGEQNLSYAILHLDVNETNKIGEKILYLPIKNNKGIVCVNDNATNPNDINAMIENDCNGNWRIMNENNIVTFGNHTYYKIISNGTGVVELNFVFGDANKNDMLDLEDAFKIIEHNLIGSNIYIPPRADIDHDKVVDIFDAVEVLEKISNPKPPSTNVVEANNRFAFDPYFKFKENENNDSNIFFSPYSILTALSMTYEGARGETAEEMENVLHLPDDKEKIHSDFVKLNEKLNKQNESYNLSVANALWAQNGYNFLDEYFKTIEQYYNGNVTNLDFIDEEEREKSRQTINNWVENKTNNKIRDLIPKGALNELTRLVLTNAIYFKGTWKWEFNESDTHDQDFKITPNNTVKVPMMYMKPNKAFNYTETDKLQILELPYKGDNISMLILLPRQNYTLKDINLSYEKFKEYKSQMKETKLDDIYLPKFNFSTKYYMKGTLSAMGMPTAFSDAADFSGMTGEKDLSISHVIHQAYVKVDEKGTEAAAATGVVGITGLPQPVIIFKADHPFIFIIQEKETGTILFMGRVADPLKN